MPALAVDLDKIATFRNVVDHRGFQVELSTQLVKVGHFQLGAMLDAAAGGLELAKQQFEQSSLARTVVADQTNTVAAQHVQIQIAHQRHQARPGETDLV